jgi:hypothetical protein
MGRYVYGPCQSLLSCFSGFQDFSTFRRDFEVLLNCDGLLQEGLCYSPQVHLSFQFYIGIDNQMETLRPLKISKDYGIEFVTISIYAYKMSQ